MQKTVITFYDKGVNKERTSKIPPSNPLHPLLTGDVDLFGEGVAVTGTCNDICQSSELELDLRSGPLGG